MKVTMSHAAGLFVLGVAPFVFGILATQAESPNANLFTLLGFVVIIAGFAATGLARRQRQ